MKAKTLGEVVDDLTFRIARAECHALRTAGNLQQALETCRAAEQLAAQDNEREALSNVAGEIEALLAADNCELLASGADLEAALGVCSEALTTAVGGDRQRLEGVIAMIEFRRDVARCQQLGATDDDIDGAMTYCEGVSAAARTAEERAPVVVVIEQLALRQLRRECLSWPSMQDLDAAMTVCREANDKIPGDEQILAAISEIFAIQNPPVYYSNDPIETGVTDVAGVTH